MKKRATEHPIIMCGEMVRAIFAGKKTETRRMAGLSNVNRSPYLWKFTQKSEGVYEIVGDLVNTGKTVKHPYGVAGDTLWVRETFALTQFNEPVYRADAMDKKGYRWHSIAVGDPEHEVKWKPSLFMRKEQSRITLTVKDVCLERLHEITDEGARAEGITEGGCLNCGNPEPCGCGNPKPSPRDAYIGLWKQLNGEESWNLNPWVWVVKFEVKEVRK